MVTSPYVWKILKWDEKPQTNNHINQAHYQGRRDFWTYCSNSLYDSIALSLASSIALSILKMSRPKSILPTIVWRLTLTLRRVFCFVYCFVCLLFFLSFFFFQHRIHPVLSLYFNLIYQSFFSIGFIAEPKPTGND